MSTHDDLIAEARSEEPTDWRALAWHLADALEAVTREKRTAEEGLFHVVQELGFDMDGARDAAEFFGPLTVYRDGKKLTAPAHIAVAYAQEYRADMESEEDKSEVKIAGLEAKIARALNHDPLHGESSGLHCGGMAPCIRRILTDYEQEGNET